MKKECLEISLNKENIFFCLYIEKKMCASQRQEKRGKKASLKLFRLEYTLTKELINILIPGT